MVLVKKSFITRHFIISIFYFLLNVCYDEEEKNLNKTFIEYFQ